MELVGRRLRDSEKVQAGDLWWSNRINGKRAYYLNKRTLLHHFFNTTIGNLTLQATREDYIFTRPTRNELSYLKHIDGIKNPDDVLI